VESRRQPPIAFAHRGASAHEPANTLAAFRLALRLGATGLEADAWTTADGVVVLDHDGRVRSGLRRVPVAEVPRSALPASVPSLDELYADCGTDYELSLDVRSPATAGAAVSVVRAAGPEAPGRLWLCHPDLDVVTDWRRRFPDVRIVNSTRLSALRRGPERRAAQLAEAGIDAVNLHYDDWTGGLVALFHRFERLAFGWDAQHERMVRALARMGIDGVYGDHVDRLVDGLGLAAP
jgi:glycerophosphoryl diester phosphodiesterase